MVITYYLITFIISFILWCFFLVSSGQKKMNINLVIIFTVVAISNGGNLALSLAKTVDVAILAQKIVYLAVIYAPLFIFYNVCAICKVNLHKIIRIFSIAICTTVYGLVLSAGYSDIYYKHVYLHRENGFTYITKDYGPMHGIYLVVLYTLTACSLLVVIVAFKRQRDVSVKNSLMLLAILSMMIIAYFTKLLLGKHIEFMPAIYCVVLLMLFIAYRRLDMYDVSNALLANFEQLNTGYIVLNKKIKFLGCNDVAKVFYPYINEIKIDRTVEDDRMLFFQIRKKVERLDEVPYVEWIKRINGYSLKCILRPIIYDGIRTGYLIEMIDDTKQQQYIKEINTYNVELEEAMDKKTKDIIEIQNKIILGIANVVESRDNSTGGHIKRTSEVVRIFAEKLRRKKLIYKLDDELLDDIIKAAPMHDLGKIAIDDRILRKPGKFTPEEYEEMKKHAKEGAKIINAVLEGVEDESFVRVARNVAHYHHEKFDGSGYPDKLIGENIPIEARIMALADVFDALVSKRCYKEEFSYDKAFSIIEESLGSHFDPVLGHVFIMCRPQLEAYYDQAR